MAKRDPNAIWGHAKDADDLSEEMKAELAKEMKMEFRASPGSIEIIRKELTSFWKKHSEEFIAFWAEMTVVSREKFLREVYSTIMYSLADCWYLERGKKIYGGGHDRFLAIGPELTVQNLVRGMTLPDIMKEWAEVNGIAGLVSEMALKSRKLCRCGMYPHQMQYKSCREYEQDLRMDRPGIIMVPIPVDGNEFQFVSVNKPADILKSRIGPVNGQYIETYEGGAIIHDFEYREAIETCHFVMTMLGAFVDEFRDEILGKSKPKALSILKMCPMCPAQEDNDTCNDFIAPSLKMCSRCKQTCYCSKEHQQEHWPQHKAICFKFNPPKETKESKNTKNTKNTKKK